MFIARKANINDDEGGNIMIKIENLSFSYKDKKIFEEMDFTFESNKVYFIISRNGTGKSTLFRLLNKEENNFSGSIYRGGEVVTHKQDPVYFEDMTVKENVETFIECLRAQISYKGVIEQNQMESIEKKVAKKLSGGEKQKLYLAITSLCDGDILLFDEADSALDAISRKMYYSKVLKRKAKDGKTVIAISHHITEVINYADKICFLKNHKLYSISPEILADNFRDLNEDKMLETFERMCDEYEEINN